MFLKNWTRKKRKKKEKAVEGGGEGRDVKRKAKTGICQEKGDA